MERTLARISEEGTAAHMTQFKGFDVGQITYLINAIEGVLVYPLFLVNCIAYTVIGVIEGLVVAHIRPWDGRCKCHQG